MFRGLCVCVCLSVGHGREQCQHGGTDRDLVWDVDTRESKEPCVTWGADPPGEEAISGDREYPFEYPKLLGR